MLDSNKVDTVAHQMSTNEERRLYATWLSKVKAKITIDQGNFNLKVADIDIAWVPIRKVPITELAIKTEALRKILDIDVDLKIVTDNYTIALRKAIFEGDVIYESKDFGDYLNYFYFENSDVIDISDWREMYGNKKDNQF